MEDAFSPHDLTHSVGGQSSRYRGVTFNKKSKKWQSVLNVSGSHVHLGTFNTEEDAAVAFDRAALMVRGDRARINFALESYKDAQGNIVEDLGLRAKIDASCDPNRCGAAYEARGRSEGEGGGGRRARSRVVSRLHPPCSMPA
eukprot:363419-Chlamydomonas_euryale.AAC.3